MIKATGDHALIVTNCLRRSLAAQGLRCQAGRLMSRAYPLA
jgi:hypothetical protein